jgi:hypothetical protein
MDEKFHNLLGDERKKRRESFASWEIRGGPIKSLKMFKQKLCIQGCKLLHLDCLGLDK